MKNEKIILFYKYVRINDVEATRSEQIALCSKLGLTGRIILAGEGINGTLGGNAESLKAYTAFMDRHHLFADIDFKESPGFASDFPRLSIKIKPEIVKLGIDPDKLTSENGGIHLTPEETHTLLNNKPENLVIIDCRNNYESKVGHFRGAIKPDVSTFREFPAYIDKHSEELKNKDVLMYCTGGIRCERASAYVKEKGVKNVYQVKGGIHRYVEAYPDGHFRGKNYVFDDRVTMRINNDVVGTCDLCNITCDETTNCANTKCNAQYIACPECLNKYVHTCSNRCKELVCSKQVSVRTTYRTRNS